MNSVENNSNYNEFYRWFFFKFSPDSDVAEMRFQSLYPQLKKVIGKNERGIDLASGGGQYTFLLTKKGYNLEGLDNNKKYLKLARDHAKKENMKVKFHEGDLTNLKLKSKYEYALFLGNSIPHFTLEEFENIAKNISRILTKDGKLIIDFNDWVYLFLTKYPQEFSECDNPKINSKHNYFDGISGIANRTFTTPENKFNVNFVIWAPYILDYVMKKAGYKLVKHYLRETNRYISVYENGNKKGEHAK